jgi:para-nitrobenzyl esterase
LRIENLFSGHAMQRCAAALAGALACLPCCLGFADAALPAASATPAVSVESGMLAGTQDGAVEVFKGIAYAAPPVGALRWEPPARAASWTGTREASTFGASCPQGVWRSTAVLAAGRPQSEDCLYLNVWTFAAARNAPVMVWIHGGGFRSGSGSQRFYDGSDFAKDGVILVTLNYRLGPLGFFAHPALTATAAAAAPLGNYGILDQIAALRWVKRNIAAFGGDPANVTVFGESAGGRSVLTLLTVSAAKGLFAKAIVESGEGWNPQKTLTQAQRSGIALAAAAGLGARATPRQLRALTVAQLLEAQAVIGRTGPFQDGRLVRESIAQAFAAGHEIHVPLIIGSNSYEASLMRSFRITMAAEAAQMPRIVRPLYAGSEQQVAAAFFTDSFMGAPARWLAARASAGAPAYLYHFSYVGTTRRGTVAGAGHGSEIPFVFGSWPAFYDRAASAQDRAMEILMHGCWVRFANSGRPACGDPVWPAYTARTDELMEFGERSGPEARFRKTRYDALQRSLLPNLLSLQP